MRVKDILATAHPTCSLEFFPPKTESLGVELDSALQELLPLKPAYVSVTYGAGGSTQDRTYDLVVRIRRETGLPVISHLTCVGSRRDQIRALLERYAANDVNDILALRGDPPRGQAGDTPPAGDFNRASDLVAFIRKEFPGMGIGVAGFPEGHPETPNRLKEIDYLKEKVDAGADYIVTQLFFDNRDFYDFCDRCHLAGIRVPIVAGILPITNRAGMVRMAELAAGSRIPAALLRSVDRCVDDTAVERVGIHWAAEQMRDLLHHRVAGIHLYTLNSARGVKRIFASLGITDASQLR